MRTPILQASNLSRLYKLVSVIGNALFLPFRVGNASSGACTIQASEFAICCRGMISFQVSG